MGSIRPHICYSCISYGDNILVSHQTEIENYTHTIRSILVTLPADDISKFTYPIDSYQVYALTDNGVIYFCITTRTCKHLLPFSFLEDIKSKFCAIPSLLSRTPTAAENELDRDFAPVLASVMYNFNIGQGDKISQLQTQVEDVKNVMLSNVEQVIQRGEQLNDLLSKTEHLEATGTAFRQQIREIHTNAKCKNFKMWLFIGVFLGIILTIAFLIATGVIRLK